MAAALPAVTTSQQHNLLHSPELLLSQKVKLSTSTQAPNMLIMSCIHMPRSGTRGFLTAKNTPIQNGPLVQDLLEAALLPHRAAVIHCKGHQRPNSQDKSLGHITHGNYEADRAANQAAASPLSIPHFLFHLIPSYSPQESALLKEQGYYRRDDGGSSMEN